MLFLQALNHRLLNGLSNVPVQAAARYIITYTISSRMLNEPFCHACPMATSRLSLQLIKQS